MATTSKTDTISASMRATIEREAAKLVNPILDAVRAGSPLREAIESALQAFSSEMARAMAEAMSTLLETFISPLQVLELPIGEIRLSTRLYTHTQQTAQEVTALVQQHANGIHQARELALRLFDGYNPDDGIKRPLEGRARADLPRALRAITADAPARASLAAVIERGQAQASRLRTPALRAAYLQAFNAWADGAGSDALARVLKVAVAEKTRYFANRIAQTELARAHQAKVGQELLADGSITVVQVVLNPRHPQTDICDLHARADLYRLGPGCYPKERAPVPPFHPFCWCKLRSRPSLQAAMARESVDGEAAYLRSLQPGQAARVMGSRARAQAVLDGASVDSVVNAGKDQMHWLRRLGDGAGHSLVRPAEPPAMATPYEIAQQPGGAHHGMLTNIRKNLGINQLRAGVAKMTRQIDDHSRWINDPASKPGVMDHPAEDIARWVNEKWPSDIARLKEQRAIYEAVIKEKESGNVPGGS